MKKRLFSILAASIFCIALYLEFAYDNFPMLKNMTTTFLYIISAPFFTYCSVRLGLGWKSISIVNQYSLLYTWEGSDQSLKPMVLAAHMDVAGVEEGTGKN